MNGQLHGRGTYLEHGKRFEVDFFEGQQHGKGTYWYEDGSKAYEGDWAYGELHGKGKLWHEDGSIYEGDFVEDKK